MSQRTGLIILLVMGPALLQAFVLGPATDRFFDTGDKILWIAGGVLVSLVLWLVSELFFGTGGFFGPPTPPPTPEEITAFAAWKIAQGGQEIAEGLEMLEHLRHAAEHEAHEQEKQPPPKKGINWWWVIVFILGGAVTFWWLFLR